MEDSRVPRPTRGYLFAVINMLVSGVAIYVNGIGVKMFSDSTLYTALKNGVVGIVLLAILSLTPRGRPATARISGRQWLLLLCVALIGGSIPYALYFRGLQLSTPVTASLIDHTQFLLVGVFAAVFLRERLGAGVWIALGVLLAGLSVGVAVSAVRIDAGAVFLAAGTVLFAVDFVLMKHLLRSVPPRLVMAAKMSLGSALLLGWVALTGHLGAVTTLSLIQWGFVLVTGAILLVFTLTSVYALRHASATAATAIPAGAPIVTTLLTVAARGASVPPVRWLGLGLVLAAVVVVIVLGGRREARA